MLGFPIPYFKGMRLMTLQLSSFYSNVPKKGEARASMPCKGPLRSPKVILVII